MEILKYIIPIITFILGAGFTLFLKRTDKRDANLQANALELSNLATDWYTQIHTIFADAKNGKPQSELEKDLYFYNQNRMILPKYLRSLASLHHNKRAKKLTEVAELYLALLTTYQPSAYRREWSDHKGVLMYGFKKPKNMINNIDVYSCRCLSVTDFSTQIDIALYKNINSTAIVPYAKNDLLNRNNVSSKSDLNEAILTILDSYIQEINKEAANLI